MNDNAKALVAALRSGKYEQGQDTLRTGDGKFCCLGVACDISGLGRWNTSELMSYGAYEVVGGDANDVYLPMEVREWLGFGTTTGAFDADELPEELTERLRSYAALIESDGTSTLALMNDNRIPFEVIADVIEAEPAGLFKVEDRY